QFLVVRRRFDEVAKWLKRIEPSTAVGPHVEYAVAEQRVRGKIPFVSLLTEGRAPVTLLYWLVNFTNLFVAYFLAGLLPTILTDNGLVASTSASIGGVMQAGGVFGCVGLAWLIAKKGFTPVLS